MKDSVLAALRAIEAQAQVRILLAVESGSRAWGFASPDSDYDVRFIYVHPQAWYLSVFESRDVIEQMLPGDLDLAGWDLRKSLRLFSKCNLALNEWLGSSVVYDEMAGFRPELQALIPDFFNPMRATHHYGSMAQQSLAHLTSDNRISIKKLLYAWRALLACRWIRHHTSQPPTRFQSIVAAVASADEQPYLAELLARKSAAPEQGDILLNRTRANAMSDELEMYKRESAPANEALKPSFDALDIILRQWTVT